MNSREENIRLLMAQQELERRNRVAPLITYKPHAGQQRFHAANAEKGVRVTIVHSGNRFGKSFSNGAEIVAWCYGYRPWEVPGLQLTAKGDYPPRSEVPPEYWIRRPDGVPINLPAKILAVSGLAARQGILGIMYPAIEHFIPPAVRRHPDYRINRGAMSVPMLMRFPAELSTGGAEIHFGSGEQDPMQFEGQNFTGVAIDEPPKRSIWTPIWRGLTDRYGRAWITCTPVGANAPWLYQEFIASGMKNVRAIGGSIHENPHLSEDAVEEFLETGGFTDEERDAREKGAWSFLTHRAFPQFDPAVHIVPETTPVPAGSVIGMTCDPAHRRPFMMIWGAWNAHGELLIYDEWPNEDHWKIRSSTLTVPDYARLIRGREEWKTHYRRLDPRFGTAGPRIKGEVHTSIQEDFARAGMQFDCMFEGTEREEIGIELLRQMLRYDTKRPLSPMNRPKIRVRANCINVINALQYSNFQPPSARDPDILPDKLAEQYKDARDCLRYLVIHPPLYLGHGQRDGYISQQDLESHNNDWFL